MNAEPRPEEHYLRYTRKQQMDRSVHELEGVLRGIAADGRVSPGEVRSLGVWVEALGNLRNRAPFVDIADQVERVIADGAVDAEELADLLWALEKWTTPNVFFDAITADIQRLHGMVAGILADGHVNDDELAALADWLDERDHLRTTWPYDEISAVLTHVRKDRAITDDARELVKIFLADLVPTDEHRVLSIESIDLSLLTVRGICAVDPVINLKGKKVCFTGRSEKSGRGELSQIVAEHGGLPVNRITRDLGYLVLGAEGNACWAFACYGRKIEKAMHLRRHDGSKLLIVHEVDFWDALVT